MTRIVTLVILATLAIALFAVFILPWLLPRPGLDGTIPEQPFSDSAFIEIDSTRLHYRSRLTGHSEKKLVVLIHGFGGSSFSWRHSLDALESEGYRAIAIDLPPFGYSERRADGPDWASLVLRLADEIDPEAELVLIGHSMGARVAAQAAAHAGERASQLVMVAGTPAVNGRTRGGPAWMTRIPSLTRWAEILAAHRLIDEDEFKTLLGSALGRTPSPEELSGYREPLTVPGTYPALLRRLALESEHQTGNWHSVSTSLVWGEQDRWVPLAQAHALLEDHPELPLHTMPETGHNPMDTHADEFNEILIGILRH